MKYYRLTLLFISLFLLSLKAGYSEEAFQFNSGYAVFKESDEKALIEIYYSFYQGSLKYINENGSYKANVIIDIRIVNNADNSVLMSQPYSSNSILNDTSGSEIKRNLIGQMNFSINPGEYLLEIIGSDQNNNLSSDTQKYTVLIPENLTALKLSDVELSSSITKSTDANNSFYKNTLLIIPNPSSLFGNTMKRIYYYFELYNLSTDSGYILEKNLYDMNKNLVIADSKSISPKNNSIAEYGTMGIDTLKSGIYFLNIALESKSGESISSKEKKLFVFNVADNISGNSGVESQNFLTSEYSQMKDEEIEREYDVSRYIRTDLEKKNYGNLSNLDEKRKFMFEFWKKRDSNKETAQNEFKIDYFKKVNEANKLFKESFKEGFTTDRGRIYVTYGKPDDVDNFPFQADKKSYQMWKYNSVEGGGECVFIELNPSVGSYILVHSTFRNELRNDGWESQLSNQN
ncbi:MAG: GWxTD domain-containing protein [bacterium]|nr:GWxTD domain-containing protein [bacterium]